MSARKFGGWTVLVVLVASAACGGGGGDGASTPTSPSTGGGSSAVTINIVATNGSQSFTPNPAAQAVGGTVSFRTGDGLAHRIVANDGSFDTGDLAPGVTSRALQPSAAGANYHCSIHPAMVGSIGSAQGEPPPMCTGQYCG